MPLNRDHSEQETYRSALPYLGQLRDAGFAVVVFNPGELNGADPRAVQDRMVEAGWDVIGAIGANDDDESEICDDPECSDPNCPSRVICPECQSEEHGASALTMIADHNRCWDCQRAFVNGDRENSDGDETDVDD